MEKLYYSINEIAEQLGHPVHTIRYWEQQFPFLKSKKTKTGARLYTKEQFNKFQYIHKEIYNHNMSVAGLKKKVQKSDICDQIVLSKEEFKEIMSLFRMMFELIKLES